MPENRLEFWRRRPDCRRLSPAAAASLVGAGALTARPAGTPASRADLADAVRTLLRALTGS
ncbi:hypothetical protein ACLQ24_15000 [Micromonospora sp. DT4]|uniref:hypothetical protein n=1 Tax=Micromonospora sp. DT4 TaxID=3393438 RepID=UPI003CEBAE75